MQCALCDLSEQEDEAVVCITTPGNCSMYLGLNRVGNSASLSWQLRHELVIILMVKAMCLLKLEEHSRHIPDNLHPEIWPWEIPFIERLLFPQVFELGRVNRATDFTNVNEHSSRSHALLIVSVTGINLTSGARTVGTIWAQRGWGLVN